MQSALPQCAAIVHHGGAGTTISALSVGVPQVVVPQGADQFVNAAAVERRGCGTQAGPDPAQVRDAVRRAVAGVFDTAVGQVRGEIQELPAPAAVAGALVELLAAR